MEKTWKYTTEQLRKIYDGDIDARNTFYFDNLDIITRMAQVAYDREKHPTVTVDDLIQGAYVDMDYFCHGKDRPVTNVAEIAGFFRWSFHVAPYGGLAYCKEHNPKVACASYQGYFNSTYTDSKLVRLDALMRENSEKRGTVAFEEYVNTDGDDDFAELGVIDCDDNKQSEDYTAECVTLLGGYLTPKNREVFELTADGYTATQIAEKLGLKLGATSTRQNRIREVFSKRMPDIVATLADYGINADGIADRQPQRFNKTSEKQLTACKKYYERNRDKINAKRRARNRAKNNPNNDHVA